MEGRHSKEMDQRSRSHNHSAVLPLAGLLNEEAVTAITAVTAVINFEPNDHVFGQRVRGHSIGVPTDGH